MSNPYKGPKFAVLKAKWDKKLAKSGFEDIETPSQRYPDGPHLNRYDDKYFRSEYAPSRFDDIAAYYRAASSWLWEYKFKNKRQKKIWQMHSEGMTQQAIGDKLGLAKPTIGAIVREVKKAMLESMNGKKS